MSDQIGIGENGKTLKQMMEENAKLKRQLSDYNLMFDNMAKKGV